MYVRNLSNSQIPWNFIYAFILMNSLLHVAYVRNFSVCYITWNYIHTLICGSICLHVMNVRNILNRQVHCPFMCGLCKKSFKQPDVLKMHLHTPTEGWPFSLVFVGNHSSSFVLSRCTYTLIHCTGSLYRVYTKEWCGFRSYQKMYFSPYMCTTYTVSSGSCQSFTCTTSSSLLMLTAGPWGQFPRWRCSRRRLSVCSV